MTTLRVKEPDMYAGKDFRQKERKNRRTLFVLLIVVISVAFLFWFARGLQSGKIQSFLQGDDPVNTENPISSTVKIVENYTEPALQETGTLFRG